MQTRRKVGFTLIELLVVVAIIALLIAILLPSLNKARKSAKTASCLANARSIGISLKTYMSDWNSLLPYVSSSNAAYATTYWIALLLPYGNVEKVRQCPEATDPNTVLNSLGSATSPWYAPGNNTSFGTGAYGTNGFLFSISGFDGAKMLMTSISKQASGSAWPASAFWSWPVTKLNSSIPMVADAAYTNGWPDQNDPAPPTSIQGPSFNIDPATGAAETTGTKNLQMHRYVVNRHNKSTNVAFFDGHGETVTIGGLWTLNWNASWNRNTAMVVPSN